VVVCATVVATGAAAWVAAVVVCATVVATGAAAWVAAVVVCATVLSTAVAVFAAGVVAFAAVVAAVFGAGAAVLCAAVVWAAVLATGAALFATVLAAGAVVFATVLGGAGGAVVAAAGALVAGAGALVAGAAVLTTGAAVWVTVDAADAIGLDAAVAEAGAAGAGTEDVTAAADPVATAEPAAWASAIAAHPQSATTATTAVIRRPQRTPNPQRRVPRSLRSLVDASRFTPFLTEGADSLRNLVPLGAWSQTENRDLGWGPLQGDDGPWPGNSARSGLTRRPDAESACWSSGSRPLRSTLAWPDGLA